MFTPEEQAFVDYWATHRDAQKKTLRQFLLGIPVALLFVIPIILNLFAGWNKQADMLLNTSEFNPGVLLIALLIIVTFIAIFSRRFRWDQNEQRYRELLARQEREKKSEKR